MHCLALFLFYQEHNNCIKKDMIYDDHIICLLGSKRLIKDLFIR